MFYKSDPLQHPKSKGSFQQGVNHTCSEALKAQIHQEVECNGPVNAICLLHTLSCHIFNYSLIIDQLTYQSHMLEKCEGSCKLDEEKLM